MGEPIDIDAIEARANAATPGPWRWILGYGIGVAGVGSVTLDSDGPRRTPDQEFVCAARTDVPALCAALRERDAEIARLREAMKPKEIALPPAEWGYE